MKKPEIGSKVVYVKPTENAYVFPLDMDIGMICTVIRYLDGDRGVAVSFNKGNVTALFWDEIRELTLLEKELYED